MPCTKAFQGTSVLALEQLVANQGQAAALAPCGAQEGSHSHRCLARRLSSPHVSSNHSFQFQRMESLKLECLAGKEAWFNPAWLAMGVGGGKPPFLTCEFKQPERLSEM